MEFVNWKKNNELRKMSADSKIENTYERFSHDDLVGDRWLLPVQFGDVQWSGDEKPAFYM